MSNTNSIIFMVMLVFLGVLLPLSTNSAFLNQVDAAQSRLSSHPISYDIITVQNTSMSVPAPNARTNNQSIPHQIVVALPMRNDGKIWVGTATFTASKPVEVEVEHKYDPKIL